MKLEKILDKLYKLTANEGKTLKRISNGEVLSPEIYFGKEEMANDFEEIEIKGE